MLVARVLAFFSFAFRERDYSCALIHWLVPHGDEPDDDTGMWVVRPEYAPNHRRALAVIHLGSIARGAHLLPVYGSSFLPEDFHYSYSLNVFNSFFVNKYADHHTHEFIG